MSRRSLRITLLFLGVAAIGGAAFLIWSSTRIARIDASNARAFDEHARAIAVAIADLRAAQQAYVAAGQGEDFWFARVASLEKEIDERLAALRRIARSPDAIAEMSATASALQDFAQMDARARELTRTRQTTAASDMVFSDGFDLSRKAGDAIERAVLAEHVERDAAGFEGARRHDMALAGAGAIAILSLLTLTPRPRRTQTPSPAAEPTPLPTADDAPFADLHDFGLVARPAAAPPSRVNLDQIAALCGDLARITDTRALPGLLERAAAVLDASGIVLWIADPDGRELSPILVHGYPPQLATRLGTILRDAENVTASAYRTGLLQTVKADTISNGAIAVPLVSPGGCVGVMAAEVKNGGEQHDALLAAASIIAAQLATLVGPPSARAKTEAAS